MGHRWELLQWRLWRWLTTPRTGQPAPAPGRAARVFVETTLAAHLAVAALYWWMSPKGFPVLHNRFWLNSVLPTVVVAAIAAALYGLLRRRYAFATGVCVALAAAWGMVAPVSPLYFPVSLGGLWAAAFLPTAVLGLCCAVLLPRTRVAPYVWCLAFFAGQNLGDHAIFSQLPPRTGVQPLNEKIDIDAENLPGFDAPGLIGIGPHARLLASTGEVLADGRSLSVRCEPLLSFDRVSPDGFWSLLAPEGRTVRKLTWQGADDADRLFRYNDGSLLAASASTDPSRVEVTAFSELERVTYSHLNSFCVLRVSGHKRLTTAFSPCGDEQIEVLPADYPTGRPARFAYFDADQGFRVVEASSGEKGPFRQLAQGELQRGDPLTIQLYDEGVLAVSVTLHDWSAQADATLSPTAGWRVPVNAIEFQRLGPAENDGATFWITLAATSVGRGWECVGHGPGTYRNRVTFELHQTP